MLTWYPHLNQEVRDDDACFAQKDTCIKVNTDTDKPENDKEESEACPSGRLTFRDPGLRLDPSRRGVLELSNALGSKFITYAEGMEVFLGL